MATKTKSKPTEEKVVTAEENVELVKQHIEPVKEAENPEKDDLVGIKRIIKLLIDKKLDINLLNSIQTYADYALYQRGIMQQDVNITEDEFDFIKSMLNYCLKQ